MLIRCCKESRGGCNYGSQKIALNLDVETAYECVKICLNVCVYN